MKVYVVMIYTVDAEEIDSIHLHEATAQDRAVQINNYRLLPNDDENKIFGVIGACVEEYEVVA